MPITTTKRNTTPATMLNSRKPMISNTIHRTTAKLPTVTSFFGNSIVLLIFSSPSGLIALGSIRSLYCKRSMANCCLKNQYDPLSVEKYARSEKTCLLNFCMIILLVYCFLPEQKLLLPPWWSISRFCLLLRIGLC